MSAAPILVFGAGGQVGQDLLTLARARGVPAEGVTRAEVDIADAAAVERALGARRPRLLVNAAAYTAVDKAEAEPDAARRGNVEGPAVLARAASRLGVPIVHLSTDYVFDGTKRGAYTEDDPIAPLGVYGRTKAAGEEEIRNGCADHVILRTAWVYGVHGKNFLKTMMRLAAERDRLRVVADQHGCPTATADIAEAILAVDATIAAERSGSSDRAGTYHFAGTGATTWHGFAEAIVAAQATATGRHPPVDPITTDDFPTPARRPANSELASERFVQRFGYRARPWRARVEEVVAALSAG